MRRIRIYHIFHLDREIFWMELLMAWLRTGISMNRTTSVHSHVRGARRARIDPLCSVNWMDYSFVKIIVISRLVFPDQRLRECNFIHIVNLKGPSQLLACVHSEKWIVRDRICYKYISRSSVVCLGVWSSLDQISHSGSEIFSEWILFESTSWSTDWYGRAAVWTSDGPRCICLALMASCVMLIRA